MTQAERDEEAAAAYEYERLRSEGVSLKDIGAGKVKIQQQEDSDVASPVDEKIDVKRNEVA